MPAPIIIADSITRVGPEAAGAVVVNASHGGVYAAYLAAKLQAAAVIFNDYIDLSCSGIFRKLAKTLGSVIHDGIHFGRSLGFFLRTQIGANGIRA